MFARVARSFRGCRRRGNISRLATSSAYSGVVRRAVLGTSLARCARCVAGAPRCRVHHAVLCERVCAADRRGLGAVSRRSVFLWGCREILVGGLGLGGLGLGGVGLGWIRDRLALAFEWQRARGIAARGTADRPIVRVATVPIVAVSLQLFCAGLLTSLGPRTAVTVAIRLRSRGLLVSELALAETVEVDDVGHRYCVATWAGPSTVAPENCASSTPGFRTWSSPRYWQPSLRREASSSRRSPRGARERSVAHRAGHRESSRASSTRTRPWRAFR